MNQLRNQYQHIMSLDPKVQGQIDLLNYCIDNDIHLSKYLNSVNKSYEDLFYLNYSEPSYTKTHYNTLDDFMGKKNDIPVISFFSGAGGLDLGFEAAGFMHQALFEYNDLFCETLKHNRKNWDITCADVSNKEEMYQHIKSRIGNSKTFNGVFVGGPPCQPFSIAANQRFSKNGENFKRVGFKSETGNLLFNYIDLIISFRPKVFLIENVPGLIDVDGGEQLAKAYEILENNGYSIEQPMILKADSYYVPQQRIRMFIIGTRLKKEYHPPKPSKQICNVGSIFDLSLENVNNHITREHNAESVLRYMMLDYGQRDHLGRVDRLDPSLPSKTVIAGGTAGGGRSHLHPFVPRTLSVRESARIQTFPDDYEFLGPVARQFTQVGNAVPPVLAAQLANSIYKSFFN